MMKKFLGLAIAIAAPLVNPSAARGAPALSIRVVLSPGALRTLRDADEAITVASSFYGDPSHAGRHHVDQVGQIALVRREALLPAVGGVARFPLSIIPPAQLRWVKGPTMVNVNVYSARRRFKDNVLACDFLDGRVPAAARMPIVLRCGLIRENLKTRAIS